VTALGTRIRQARVEAGISREQLAVLLGVSLPSIQRWETGRNEPTFRRVNEIGRVTGKPVEWFTGDGNGAGQ